MSIELEFEEYLDEFVRGGPKNYAYVIRTPNSTKEPKTVCKARGITVNYNASQLVNSDVIIVSSNGSAMVVLGLSAFFVVFCQGISTIPSLRRSYTASREGMLDNDLDLGKKSKAQDRPWLRGPQKFLGITKNFLLAPKIG
jgi:hypothetical protein